MNRYANKSEVMLALERGGRIESHDSQHWLIKSDGEYARLRYSLWNSLYPRLVKIGKERRPPSVLPFFVWKLKQV